MNIQKTAVLGCSTETESLELINIYMIYLAHMIVGASNSQICRTHRQVGNSRQDVYISLEAKFSFSPGNLFLLQELWLLR